MNSQFYPLTVTSIAHETAAAVRIGFSVPLQWAARFRYLPGQYLTFQAKIGTDLVRRSYSICSGVNDAVLEVAIKRVEGGLFSNFANDLVEVGDTIDSMIPQGNFSASLNEAHNKSYLFISAGSGITPVISNIRSILDVEPRSRVTLLFGNQRTSTIMFREALGFLKNRYMDRLHWVNILSQEDQGSDLLNGRLDNKKGGELNRRLIDLESFDEYFICGPESMISEVSRGLRSIGAAEEVIHYELFAASAEDARRIVEKHHERARDFAGRMSQVTVIVDGRSVSFELSADGENVLDSGINQGLDLPFSCKGGVCSTCKARLTEGEVDMDITHGLDANEVKAGYILTCQAHPISERVVVDFDQK